MNGSLLRLECLPNELLIDIFQYFHSRQLFQAFYNLNYRFNSLLQSLAYLSLALSTNSSDEEVFVPYIRILTIDRAIDTNLDRFTQVRYLILRYPTERLLAQLNHPILPHLEHLVINLLHTAVLERVPDLCDRLFSNRFPHLKSCFLFEWWTITSTQHWLPSLSLHTLKVGKIDLCVYKGILSVCPNLYFLQFATLTSPPTPLTVVPHLHLKRMVIKTKAFDQPWTDEIIDSCLSYVPYLEYFSVHRTDIMIRPKYSWLASIIACHLPFLRRFDFYFHTLPLQAIFRPDLEMILHEFRKDFHTAHQNRYQSRLII